MRSFCERELVRRLHTFARQDHDDAVPSKSSEEADYLEVGVDLRRCCRDLQIFVGEIGKRTHLGLYFREQAIALLPSVQVKYLGTC